MSKTRCSYDIVSISSILCRYRTYISIIRNLYNVDIVSISSCTCRINCFAVDIVSWLLDKLYCCRYRRYRYNIVMFLLDQLYCRRYHWYRCHIVMFLLDQLYLSRYRYDIVSWLSDQLYCRRYQFDIDTITFRDCWISCIAVDVDTISSCDCWISCITVDIVKIDTISIYIVMFVFHKLYCGTQHRVNLLYTCIYVHINIKMWWDRQQVNHTTVSDKITPANVSQFCIIKSMPLTMRNEHNIAVIFHALAWNVCYGHLEIELSNRCFFVCLSVVRHRF